MTTHFITAEIDLTENVAELNEAITKELAKQGEPLRWAITEVDKNKSKIKVEAIVSK